MPNEIAGASPFDVTMHQQRLWVILSRHGDGYTAAQVYRRDDIAMRGDVAIEDIADLAVMSLPGGAYVIRTCEVRILPWGGVVLGKCSVRKQGEILRALRRVRESEDAEERYRAPLEYGNFVGNGLY